MRSEIHVKATSAALDEAHGMAQPTEQSSIEQAREDSDEEELENKGRKKFLNRSRSKLTYKIYFDFRKPIARLQPHQILAINRGEREKALLVIIRPKLNPQIDDVDDGNAVSEESLATLRSFLPSHLSKKNIDQAQIHQLITEAIKDGYKRLLFPSLEREVRKL